MSVRISLTLEASEMFLFLHKIFRLERERLLSGLSWKESLWSFVRDDCPNLKFFTSSNLWPFNLISLWKPFGLFIITFVLSGPISILYLVVVLSRGNQDASFFFFCIYDNVICKADVGNESTYMQLLSSSLCTRKDWQCFVRIIKSWINSNRIFLFVFYTNSKFDHKNYFGKNCIGGFRLFVVILIYV